MSTSVSKIVAERSHRTLLELVLKPGNDVCADCKARAPRWASYNLGIFICVNCASIHRKIGTHITKVKSITLDEWSKEQVEVMKEKGNVKSNALYNPDEAWHPPPTNMIDSARDSELEKFIRSKYEFKRFMTRKSGRHLAADAVLTVPRPRSTPLADVAQIERKTSPGPPLPPKTPENLPSRLRSLATVPSHNLPPTRYFSHPLPPVTSSDKLTPVHSLRQPAVTRPSTQKPAGQVWEDLISLQGPSQSSSLPLQYSPVSPITSFPSQPQAPVQQQPTTLRNAPNPFMKLSLGPANATTPLVVSPILISTPGTKFSSVPSAPLSSPALHLGATNPFSQALPAASANGTAFSTSTNPFSSSPMPMSIATSMPTTPSAQPVLALPTGALLHIPPLPYVTSQTSTPVPALSFPHMPFATSPTPAGLVQNPFGPVSAPGQMPLTASGAMNPFSAMQMEQPGFSGSTPQNALGTMAFLSQQQQLGPIEFGGRAEQGAQGSF
ncbi:ArfGap-domain-containing protein [Imleria badia]|nr:ArfGap-domain-containing protein [Imleria badia]